jgi:ketosteroid isomerase-like protein
VTSANVDLVRSTYAAWERGDGSEAEWVHPDAEADLTAVYPDQPILRGIDEMRSFRDTAWGTTQQFEPERYFDVDDERVLVFVRGRATGLSSGAAVEAQPAHMFTIQEGLLVRLKVYLDRAEALDAAGLEK